MSSDLTFDQPAPDAGQAPSCTVCGTAIPDRYFLAGQQVVCASCRKKLEDELSGRYASGGLARALLFGLVAAAAGSALYYAILALSGYEIGLVAIAVGWMVGRAVFVGSGKRGGRVYQVAAVLLTYFAIVTTYIPLMFKAAREQGLMTADSAAVSAGPLAGADSAAAKGRAAAVALDAGDSATAAVDSVGAVKSAAALPDSSPTATQVSLVQFLVAMVALLGLAAALPVLAGIGNIIGMAIIAFALFEAWKLTAKVTIAITGPFAVGAGGAAGTPPPSGA